MILSRCRRDWTEFGWGQFEYASWSFIVHLVGHLNFSTSANRSWWSSFNLLQFFERQVFEFVYTLSSFCYIYAWLLKRTREDERSKDYVRMCAEADVSTLDMTGRRMTRVLFRNWRWDKLKTELNTSHEDVKSKKFMSPILVVHSKGGIQLRDPMHVRTRVCVCSLFPTGICCLFSLADTFVLVSILSFFLLVANYYLVVNKPLFMFNRVSLCVHHFTMVGSQQHWKVSIGMQCICEDIYFCIMHFINLYDEIKQFDRNLGEIS